MQIRNLILPLCLFVAAPLWASETDQFMTWDLLLEDSGPVLNEYLNAEAEIYLEKANARMNTPDTAEEVVREYYLHLFQGLQSSRLRSWLGFDEAVDRHPKRSTSNWDYQKESVFRDPAFPWILPMSRTIRLADVYLGIDKVAHFFGFGRRYFQKYLRILPTAENEHEAEVRIIKAGIQQESSLVGGFVDGIFSTGDLEANYQGFRMARDLISGAAPAFVRADGEWILARPIDILQYITPDMDESYNPSVFTRRRKTHVLRVLREEFCDKRDGEIVSSRFERYSDHEPSLSQQVIADHFADKRNNELEVQQLDSICDCAEGEEDEEGEEGEEPEEGEADGLLAKGDEGDLK